MFFLLNPVCQHPRGARRWGGGGADRQPAAGDLVQGGGPAYEPSALQQSGGHGRPHLPQWSVGAAQPEREILLWPDLCECTNDSSHCTHTCMSKRKQSLDTWSPGCCVHVKCGGISCVSWYASVRDAFQLVWSQFTKLLCGCGAAMGTSPVSAGKKGGVQM